VSPVRPPRAPLQTIDQTSPSKRPKMVIDPNVTFNTSGSNTSLSVGSNEVPAHKVKMPIDEEEGREKSPQKLMKPTLILDLLPTK
jgi:hypothetical protein